MKHLTDVLKSSMTSLYESIFDDDIVTRKVDQIEYFTREFIKENYGLNDGDYEIIKNHKNEYIVNCKTSVLVENSKIDSLTSLTNGQFKFGYVQGNFNCYGCYKLKSLEGAPKKCKIFNCEKCYNLESLEGSPEECKEFLCADCSGLKSFKGLPKGLPKGCTTFSCSNTNLSSLKELKLPEKMDIFVCGDNELLTSLEGSPKECYFFVCSGCKNLKSLEGSPKKVFGNFYCYGCKNLESLEGSPQEVGKIFSCTGCTNLTSLEGAPKYVTGKFECYSCENLTSLKGAPKYVGDDFDCSYCGKLTSLEGVPEKIDGNLDCRHCPKLNRKLKSLTSKGGDIIPAGTVLKGKLIY